MLQTADEVLARVPLWPVAGTTLVIELPDVMPVLSNPPPRIWMFMAHSQHPQRPILVVI